ncbi:hypothetical protein EJ08DRAFT_598474, partial [Tothia fuscella]
DIHVISDWARGGGDSAKVPSIISYSDHGECKWGFEAISEPETFRWTKLLLQEDTSLMHLRELNETRLLLIKHDKTAVDVVADFLRHLWIHTMFSIERALASETVERMSFQVVLTVPAIWDAKTVAKMVQAATQAGITLPRVAGETTLHVVSEPEAAALATFTDQKNRMFEAGDCFVICDAGGGTVDVITYKVNSVKPMHLSESVPGDGALCGATFLDYAFQKQVQDWISTKWSYGMKKVRYEKWLRQEWEHGLKRNFDGSEKPWIVDVPLELQKRIPWRSSLFPRKAKRFPVENGEINLSQKHLSSIFDDVFIRISHLISAQIKRIADIGSTPKGIILVGGLGCNKYLSRVLRGHFPTVATIQPPGTRAWSAVCRGAIYQAQAFTIPSHRLEAKGNCRVISRVSRLSYGILCSQLFDARCHDPKDRYFMSSTGEWCATNQIEWYIKRSDELEVGRTIRLPWKRYIPPEELIGQQITIELFQCGDICPPSRKTDSVHALCRISCAVPPAAQLPKYTNKEGREYRIVQFDLEVTLVGNALSFAVKKDGVKLSHDQISVVFL